MLHGSERTAGDERRAGERVETTIRGSTEARFERHTEDRVERVALTEGTLDLAVRKLLPEERFMVATDDAEVEVRGTVFEVEAHAGRIARVAVREGQVEVRYRRGVSMIAAGSAWRPPMEPVSATRERGSENRSRSGNHASKAFSVAVDMLGRGDYAAARSQLDAFRAAHPADERADLAAFLTIVSLQRAGRRSEAQEAARQYLELYPNGDRRADAVRVAGAR
jgi:TolA-binding protein